MYLSRCNNFIWKIIIVGDYLETLKCCFKAFISHDTKMYKINDYVGRESIYSNTNFHFLTYMDVGK